MNEANNNHAPREDADQALLNEHIAALRDVPGEPGPPTETVAATLAMLPGTGRSVHEMRFGDRVVSGRQPDAFERLLHMSFARRLAAAVLIAGGLLTLYVMFSLFSTFGTSVALADVAQKFAVARTISYRSTVTPSVGQPMTIKTIASEPDRIRTEMPDGTVTIISGHTTLLLSPASKTARRTEMTFATSQPAKGQAGSPGGIVKALRSLGEMKGEPAGEKEIAGVATKGFRVPVGGMVMTIWADAKTAMPVLVETKMPSAAGENLVVMDEFRIDPPVDEKMFSLDPPEGYTLKTTKLDIPMPATAADAVVNLLRLYAERNDGKFPVKIDDWQAYSAIQKDETQDKKLSFSATMGATMGHLFSLQSGYGYAGQDAKLGDADKVVFWYKPTPDSKTYQAVFGDLRIETVEKDRVPATPPAAAK